MTVRRQLFLAAGVLVLVIVSLGVWLVYTSADLASLTMQTELASRQGTLAQRVTNHALLFREHRDAERAMDLRRTVSQFQESLWGLLAGGRVPLDAAGREYRFVPPVDDEEARLVGRRQLAIWRVTRAAADTFVDSGGSDADALALLTTNDAELVAAAGEMTGRLVIVASDWVDRIRLLQIISVIASLITGAIVFLVGHRVSRSIAVLTSSADVMSRGKLDLPVPVNGTGETAELGRSLERMRISLKKAMDLLERKS
ncbi:MAG: HAMP domain-containing protein [Deltaproteobacteria bacterium]|nr:HAMP domain-containing protein [Deltaproteobacteria bacterium]